MKIQINLITFEAQQGENVEWRTIVFERHQGKNIYDPHLWN